MVETRTCLFCGVRLNSKQGAGLFCSPEHKFSHCLKLLQEAATPHHGINPVEAEHFGTAALESKSVEANPSPKRRATKRSHRRETKLQL